MIQEAELKSQNALPEFSLSFPYDAVTKAMGLPPQIGLPGQEYTCKSLEERFMLDLSKPKPDFLFLGVAKGGSTSFSQYIIEHPQVQRSKVKEANFFSFPEVLGMTPAKYQNQFYNVVPGQGHMVAGDYSTAYIMHPLTPRRVLTYLGTDVKLILFLRNPIDRAYSHYTMQARGKMERELTFEQIIELEIEDYSKYRKAARRCFQHPSCDTSLCFPEEPLTKHNSVREADFITNESQLKGFYFKSYLARSVYDDMLERWLAVFPRENFYITSSERFYAETETVMSEITNFLGLRPFDWSQAETLKMTWGGGPSNGHQAHDYPPLSAATRKKLNEYLTPFNRRVYEMVGEDYGWE